MTKTYLTWASAIAALAVSITCCQKEDKFVTTKYEDTNMPEELPYGGGSYAVTISHATVTKAAQAEFLPWQVRLSLDGVEGQIRTISEVKDTIMVHVPANYGISSRSVKVEASFGTPDSPASADSFETIFSATQNCALVKVAEFYWAKGNLTLKNGKFAIADKMSETGLFFKKGSQYGILPSDKPYAGTAYKPEPIEIALADIPENNMDIDPCTLADPTLRMPTQIEAVYLLDETDNEHTLDGVKGIGFKNTDFFIPFTGTLDKATGTYTKNDYAGYWLLGEDYDGNRMVYAISDEYSMVYYDLTDGYLGTLRCVRNIKQPSYVSHSPATLTDDEAFELTVETDPGDFPFYKVNLVSDNGDDTELGASPKVPNVKFNIPANTMKKSLVWKIFVNGRFTGKTLEQPAMQDYALYAGHTPKSADYKAFTLKVTVDTDMNKVPVDIKTPDGVVYSKDASRWTPVVEIPIPENTGDERTLSIFINGKDTGKTVVQGGAPAKVQFSVIWSEGYLTVKDGAYTFAGPKERGMYFKYKSRYAIDLGQEVTASSKYSGTAYGPEPVQKSYEDLTYNEVDPCSLVLPAGTWRLPTAAEFTEMTKGGSVDTVNKEYYMCTDGTQKVYLPSGGQLKDTGSGVTSPTNVFVWTADLSDSKPETQAKYLLWMFSASGTPKIGPGTNFTKSIQVRCVRSK